MEREKKIERNSKFKLIESEEIQYNGKKIFFFKN